MGKVTGFREYDRQVPGYQPVEERIRHWREFALPMAETELRTQGARCMDCGVPFCHDGCPLGNIIPDFNDHVYQGRWQARPGVAHLDEQLPGVHRPGLPRAVRVGLRAGHQPAPGHHQVHRGRHHRARLRGGLDGSPRRRASARAVRWPSSAPGRPAWPPPTSSTGPATAVTVFERADRIGGLLRYGIPDFKLGEGRRRPPPRRSWRPRASRSAPASTSGSTTRPRSSWPSFDAVVLAGGSTTPRDLPIPGRDATGRRLRHGLPAPVQPPRGR